MIAVKYLRQYIRQILSESEIQTYKLAAFVNNDGQTKKATIYDTETLKPFIQQLLDTSKKISLFDLAEEASKTSIKGTISIQPPPGPCNGAWEVIAAAAPESHEFASITYSIGYALSPNGRLVSDRTNVSPQAQNAWKNIYNQNKRKKLPLDDINAHNHNNSPKYDHPNHTDDSKDDCKLYGGKNSSQYPHLQHSYDSKDDDQEKLSQLLNSHNSFISQFNDKDKKLVLNLLEKADDEFWSNSRNS